MVLYFKNMIIYLSFIIIIEIKLKLKAKFYKKYFCVFNDLLLFYIRIIFFNHGNYKIHEKLEDLGKQDITSIDHC
jgi:hypothetical protein